MTWIKARTWDIMAQFSEGSQRLMCRTKSMNNFTLFEHSPVAYSTGKEGQSPSVYSVDKSNTRKREESKGDDREQTTNEKHDRYFCFEILTK
jgi:hypothetical protein